MKLLIKTLCLILTLSLYGCIEDQSVSTIGIETIKEDVVSNIKTQYEFYELVETKLISEKLRNNLITVIVFCQYTTESAYISSTITIKYVKNAEKWVVQDFQSKVSKIEITRSAEIDAARSIVIHNTGPYFVEFNKYLYDPSKLALLSTLNINDVETIFTYEYNDNQGPWSIKQTYIVTAKYSVFIGWDYSLTNWTYTETTSWKGNWKIDWYDESNKLVENIDRIVVTGSLSVSDNMDGNRKVDNTLMASFTLYGKAYFVKPVIEEKFNQTNIIKIRTTDSDWFWMGYQIQGPDLMNQAYYYSVSNKFENGNLLKVE